MNNTNDSHQNKLQSVLMRIIEGFSEYFVSSIEKTYHQTPESVDVRNITVEKKFGTTGIQLVKVMLESNLGSDDASIAVKIYDKQEHALEVVKRINSIAASTWLSVCEWFTSLLQMNEKWQCLWLIKKTSHQCFQLQKNL